MKFVFGILYCLQGIGPLIVLFCFIFKQAEFYLRDAFFLYQSALSLLEGGNVETHGQKREHRG